MYKFLANIMHNVVYVFRIIQILGLLYLLLFIIYWFLELIMSSYSGLLEFMYTPTVDLTEKLLSNFGVHLTSEYAILKPMIFFSIILTSFLLILYNFIFIPLDNILEFFVDKSYTKGERGI